MASKDEVTEVADHFLNGLVKLFMLTWFWSLLLAAVILWQVGWIKIHMRTLEDRILNQRPIVLAPEAIGP